MIPVALGALAAATALGACGQRDSPLELADRTTKAVYELNVDGTQSAFDDDLKKTVTRAQVGELSDKMHALGDYKGLKARSSDPDRGRYDFEADFERGVMIVEMRLDPSGKIGAYRLVPVQAR